MIFPTILGQSCAEWQDGGIMAMSKLKCKECGGSMEAIGRKRLNGLLRTYRTLQGLTAWDVEISLEDFGSGYSSL